MNKNNEKIDKLLKLIKRDISLLEYVPDYISKEFYSKFFINSNIRLKDIPKNIINRDLCLEAVKNFGRVLEFVPEKFKDKDVCLEAVKNYIFSIKHVPKKYLLDDDIITYIIETDITKIKYIPEKLLILLDEEILLKILNKISEDKYKNKEILSYETIYNIKNIII